MTRAQPSIHLEGQELATDSFREDVLKGLLRARKTIPCKYLYDARGSERFEKICQLDEYYPTRTEMRIMQRSAPEIADAIGPECTVIEFGSGSGVKTRILLGALQDPVAYVPVDVSRSQLLASAASLAQAFPGVEILPVCGDFTREYPLPEPRRRGRRRIVYFPGSTIGNLAPDERGQLLRRIAGVVGDGGGALIGIDLQKDIDIIEAAYNDAEGVTASFTLNLLRRINRELRADFDLRRFFHHAFYNRELHRIEVHLVSRDEQTITVSGHRFHFRAGEGVHVENSYKFDREDFAREARAAGLPRSRAWTDEAGYFAVMLLETCAR